MYSVNVGSFSSKIFFNVAFVSGMAVVAFLSGIQLKAVPRAKQNTFNNLSSMQMAAFEILKTVCQIRMKCNSCKIGCGNALEPWLP